MTTYTLTASTTILRDDGAHIPADPMNTDYAAYLTWVADGGVPTPYVAPPAPPISCSAWQIRAALTQIGLRATVEAFVTASTDQDIKDAWGFQQVYLENDSMLLTAAAAIGKNKSDVHSIIALAQALSP
jgi:hypothetical protein